jgi:hypothetical protein
MNTPVVMDTFSRIMADMYDEKEVIGVSTAGQAFFGRPENGANTIFSPNANVVEIDIIRGNRKTAALIPRGTISRPLGDTQRNMNVEKYTSFARKYPLSEEEGDITADQILLRMGGENAYEGRDRLTRMRLLALKLHHENVRRHVRLFERLAWQSLKTGLQDAILGTSDTDLQYDFRRNAAHTFTPSPEWDNSGTILADIDDACELIRVNGKLNPDMIIIGQGAMAAFIADTDVVTKADTRRFELTWISTNNPVPPKYMRFVEAGMIPRGRLNTPEGYSLWVFNYLDSYETNAGTDTKYILTDEALVCSSDARCDRYFGPPERLPLIAQDIAEYMELFGFSPLSAPMPAKLMAPGSIVDPSMFHVDAYRSGDKKKVTVRTQSAPIFPTTQTDGFVLMEGLLV